MPRMDRLSPHATTISTSADGKDICIVYHSTCIVQFNDDRIILRTGGWDSVTTRRKMNQAARQFSLCFEVWREKGISYVMSGYHSDPKPMLLVDGMTLDRRHCANQAAA